MDSGECKAEVEAEELDLNQILKYLTSHNKRILF